MKVLAVTVAAVTVVAAAVVQHMLHRMAWEQRQVLVEGLEEEWKEGGVVGQRRRVQTSPTPLN
jgi:hypothetical protein